MYTELIPFFSLLDNQQDKGFMTQNAKEFNKDFYKEKDWRDNLDYQKDRNQTFDKTLERNQIFEKNLERNQIFEKNLERNQIYEKNQIDYQKDRNQIFDKDPLNYQKERNQYEKNHVDYQKERNQIEYRDKSQMFEKNQMDRDIFDKNQIDFSKDRNLFEKNQIDYQKREFEKSEKHFENEKMYEAKDFSKQDDYIPTTNEEYNKEAEKYALERKNLSSYDKSVLDYKPIENNYPKVDYMFEKNYQREDYQLYQNNYQDSVAILRNQQHNLEILQQQHRAAENQNFFNENHIKQEIDLNGDEDKFLYERSKEQLGELFIMFERNR